MAKGMWALSEHETVSESNTVTTVEVARPQRGSVMLFVLAVVLVLTMAVGALLTATRSTGVVAVNLKEFSAYTQKVDGAMEKMVNVLRDDDLITCPSNIEVYEGIQVQCTERLNVTSPTNGRKYNIQAEDPAQGGQVVGRARIYITDELNGASSVGYSLMVCDWLIGKGLVTTVTLQGCPGTGG